MDRPVRRSRQRVTATGLIGLLPQEEAAINRALHESLLEGKKKSPKNKDSAVDPTCSHISYSSSLSARAICSAGTSLDVMDFEAQDPVEGSSKSKVRRGTGRLQSPLSPSQSLDSSSESKPSSPTHTSFTGISSSSVSSPLSVESCLKLVLSTSSWSSSSSPSWSPSPEPLNSAKVAEKSQLKQKGVVRVETKQKGKRGRPRKYPPKAKTPNKAPSKSSNTTSKVPKTYTKAALQAHAVSSTKQHKVKKTGVKGKKPKKGESLQWRSELDIAPMSPEAALVLHDHCYSSDCKALNNRATGAKSGNKSSLYPVQRKFAQNQVPANTPTRPSAEEVENVSSLKEVPKTEDFITFLCLRGSKTMPKELEKFAVPWTRFQRKRPKNGLEVRRKTLTFSMKGSKLKSRNVARKLGESISSGPALGLS